MIDHYRRKQPHPRRRAASHPRERRPPHRRAEARSLLPELIDGLPATYRETLTLAEFEGLTQAEMGQRLGLSTSGVKSRVRRGRALVRQQLVACYHLELDRRHHVIDYEPAGSEQWPDVTPAHPRRRLSTFEIRLR